MQRLIKIISRYLLLKVAVSIVRVIDTAMDNKEIENCKRRSDEFPFSNCSNSDSLTSKMAISLIRCLHTLVSPLTNWMCSFLDFIIDFLLTIYFVQCPFSMRFESYLYQKRKSIYQKRIQLWNP